MTDSFTFNISIDASLEECIIALNKLYNVRVSHISKTEDAAHLQVLVNQSVPVDVHLREDSHFYGTVARGKVERPPWRFMIGLGALFTIVILAYQVTMTDEAIQFEWMGLFALVFCGVVLGISFIQAHSRRGVLNIVETCLKRADRKKDGRLHSV